MVAASVGVAPCSASEAAGGARPVFATGSVLLVVVAKSVLNLGFVGRYGWQRDELYYAVAGRHLQGGGYVEFRR
jgi:hypothetical protein